jgi:glutamate-ammonia-ligase adenylyltransferase
VDESAGSESLPQFRRLALRFVQAVSSHTREGILFPVDTRLRPRGRDGEIVQSSAYLGEYFRKEAEGWEAAAFLKARGVAGNLSLAARVIAGNQAVLRERFEAAANGGLRGSGPSDLARQLAQTRQRLEREAPRAGLLRDAGMTTGAGGFYDLDYVLSFLALAKGVSAATTGTGAQIAALESAAALSPADAAVLRDAAIFFRSLDHARRISSGLGSGAGLEPAQLPRLTALLKLWGLLDERDILPRIESTRLALRQMYRRIVMPE